MTAGEIRAALRAILGGIAPEADLETIQEDADLREELDIDSIDFQRYVVRIEERLGVSVPESDYPRIRTLAGGVAYLAERIASR